MQSIRSLSTQRLTIVYAYRLASGRLHPLVLRALRNKRIEQIAATDRHQLHKLEPTTGPAAPAVGLHVRPNMNTKSTIAPYAPYYPIIILAAVVSAVVIAPTPDFLIWIELSLVTILSGLLLGYILLRFGRLPSTGPKIKAAIAVIIGTVGSILGVIAVRLLFRLF